MQSSFAQRQSLGVSASSGVYTVYGGSVKGSAASCKTSWSVSGFWHVYSRVIHAIDRTIFFLSHFRKIMVFQHLISSSGMACKYNPSGPIFVETIFWYFSSPFGTLIFWKRVGFWICFFEDADRFPDPFPRRKLHWLHAIQAYTKISILAHLSITVLGQSFKVMT